MLKIFQRLFHHHQWITDVSEETSDGYHIVKHCKICGKIISERFPFYR